MKPMMTMTRIKHALVTVGWWLVLAVIVLVAGRMQVGL